MPPLTWSPDSRAVSTKHQRDQMTRLFEAYFRAAPEKGPQAFRGITLHLNLPNDTESRYNFHAQFTPDKGWLALARLKPEYVRFGPSRLPF
jgi:hypothetical protein